MNRTWFNTLQASIHLNVSESFLRKQRKAGHFKLGIHYRAINPHAARPTYQWNVAAIAATMSGK